MEEEITMKKLCLELQVADSTVYRWMEKGMPSISRLDGLKPTRRFELSKVTAWLKKQRPNPITTKRGTIRT